MSVKRVLHVNNKWLCVAVKNHSEWILFGNKLTKTILWKKITILCNPERVLVFASEKLISAWIISGPDHRYRVRNLMPSVALVNYPITKDPYVEIEFSNFWCATPQEMPFCSPVTIEIEMIEFDNNFSRVNIYW